MVTVLLGMNERSLLLGGEPVIQRTIQSSSQDVSAKLALSLRSSPVHFFVLGFILSRS